MRSTLFVFHLGANAGYAMDSCERAFLRAGGTLAGGDERRVHFSFRDFDAGRPRALADSGARIFQFDPFDRSPRNLHRFGSYVSEHAIDLVVPFDLDPLHPLHAVARLAGARAAVGYWGAPVSGPQPSWRRALKRLEVALAPTCADGLVCESQAMAATAIDRGFPPGRVRVNPLGVDTQRFAPGKTGHLARALGIATDRKRIVYSGHMEPRKGVAVLIEAMVELLGRRRRADVELIVCGNRPGEADPFERRAREAGIAEHIHFAGYRDDLPQLFADCDLGVIPSVGWDSFTYSALEMAASGLPLIASRLQGLAEAVLDGETGVLVPPGDANALADALEMLLESPALAAQLGAAGRARVERELSLEAQHRRFLEIFERFFAPRLSSRPLAARVRPARPGPAPAARDPAASW